jgi:hypothetical protein
MLESYQLLTWDRLIADEAEIVPLNATAST